MVPSVLDAPHPRVARFREGWRTESHSTYRADAFVKNVARGCGPPTYRCEGRPKRFRHARDELACQRGRRRCAGTWWEERKRTACQKTGRTACQKTGRTACQRPSGTPPEWARSTATTPLGGGGWRGVREIPRKTPARNVLFSRFPSFLWQNPGLERLFPKKTTSLSTFAHGTTNCKNPP